MAGKSTTQPRRDPVSARIVDSINKLPLEDRRIFILRHYRDVPEPEIAQTLQLPLEQVRESLARSSRLLMQDMRPVRQRLMGQIQTLLGRGHC